MRETVGFGIPVSSASSPLLMGPSAAATRRSSVRPRESAMISSPAPSFGVEGAVRERCEVREGEIAKVPVTVFLKSNFTSDVLLEFTPAAAWREGGNFYLIDGVKSIAREGYLLTFRKKLS